MPPKILLRLYPALQMTVQSIKKLQFVALRMTVPSITNGNQHTDLSGTKHFNDVSTFCSANRNNEDSLFSRSLQKGLDYSSHSALAFSTFRCKSRAPSGSLIASAVVRCRLVSVPYSSILLMLMFGC